MTEAAAELRTALTGLLSFAAGEEAILLTAAGDRDEPGTPDAWGALPTVAHISEFRDEQVQRLVAIRHGSVPPDFPRIDHASAENHRRYAEPAPAAVSECSRGTSAALIDETRRCSDRDLLDPSRNAWLRGRQLWLQIVVRGFWHPIGHLGDYYAQHGRPERALALHAHAVETARYLAAPEMAVGMAHYSLACVQAGTGQLEAAIGSLGRAIKGNPDLREHARTEPDLERLREAGRFTVILT